MLWIILIGIIVIIDQVVKYIIIQNVEIGSLVTVIDKFFYITHIKNTGAAWSILQGKRIFFVVVTFLACLLIGYYLYKAEHKLLKLALSLIFAGAMGNLIDRVVKGSVTDFLEFHFGSYIFPVFNIADMSVVIGTCLLAFYMFFIYKE